MSRRSIGIAMLAVLALAACNGIGSRGTSEEAVARRLVGVWDGTFTLTQSTGTESPDTVRGTIALVRNHSGRVWTPQLGAVSEYGIYDIDFRPFGFDPRDDQSIPTAVAQITTDSSGSTQASHVRIVLHPGNARVAAILDGTLTRDEITGAWQTDSRSASGTGHFILTRHVP